MATQDPIVGKAAAALRQESETVPKEAAQRSKEIALRAKELSRLLAEQCDKAHKDYMLVQKEIKQQTLHNRQRMMQLTDCISTSLKLCRERLERDSQKTVIVGIARAIDELVNLLDEHEEAELDVEDKLVD